MVADVLHRRLHFVIYNRDIEEAHKNEYIMIMIKAARKSHWSKGRLGRLVAPQQGELCVGDFTRSRFQQNHIMMCGLRERCRKERKKMKHVSVWPAPTETCFIFILSFFLTFFTYGLNGKGMVQSWNILRKIVFPYHHDIRGHNSAPSWQSNLVLLGQIFRFCHRLHISWWLEWPSWLLLAAPAELLTLARVPRSLPPVLQKKHLDALILTLLFEFVFESNYIVLENSKSFWAWLMSSKKSCGRQTGHRVNQYYLKTEQQNKTDK